MDPRRQNSPEMLSKVPHLDPRQQKQAVFRLPPVIIIKQTMRRHTYFYLTVLPLLLLAAGCTKLQTEPTIQEGIYGSVIERYGDWMPMLGQYPKGGERPIKGKYTYMSIRNPSTMSISTWIRCRRPWSPGRSPARMDSLRYRFLPARIPFLSRMKGSSIVVMAMGLGDSIP